MKASIKELLLKLTEAVYKPPAGFGNLVQIQDNYTSKASAYTVPADGLVWVQTRYTSGNYIGATMCNADGTNEISFQNVSYGTGNNNICFPICKGMKLWQSGNSGQYNYIYYYPFI